MEFSIDGVRISFIGIDADHSLARKHLEYVKARVDGEIKSIRVTAAEDGKVDIDYDASGVPFERLRRITGYLSPLNTWNDAKRAEERDRVKHPFGTEEPS